MATKYQLNDRQSEIAGYILRQMHVENPDQLAAITPRNVADALAAAVLSLADLIGVDPCTDKQLTVTRLSEHFAVSRYNVIKAIRLCRVPGSQVPGKTIVKYPVSKTREALQYLGCIA